MKWQDAPDKPGWWWYRPRGVTNIPEWPKPVYLESLDYGFIKGEYAGPLPDPPEDA
jgi:hypothetical protein